MASPPPLELIETNSAGAVVATYIESPAGTGTGTGTRKGSRRVDIVRARNTEPLWVRALGVFLPAGYPHSVTRDYLEYQIYDSLQAFSSSIAGLLCSRAVLQGVGVGDASASPTAALLLSTLQDSVGRIGTILFAHKLGTSLEPECKMYRLAADVFNDTAMILDCLSPALPRPARVVVLSLSSVLRALCGVAAGSSKATLSAHFARWGNLGELNAKDSSQETVLSLIGMLVGSLVVSRITSPFAVWSCLILLLSIHLGTNYAAVRAVSLRTLNRQRANIVFSTLIDEGIVLDPDQVARREKIFERDGALRWRGSAILGYGYIGVKLRQLLSALSTQQARGGMTLKGDVTLQTLVDLYHDEDYLLWYDNAGRSAFVILKDGASNISQVKAWVHALLVARISGLVDDIKGSEAQTTLEKLRETLDDLHRDFSEQVRLLQKAGWDFNPASLETRSKHRIALYHAPA